MTGGTDAATLARALRQRIELGEVELVLERRDREDVLALLRAFATGGGVRGAAGPGAASERAGPGAGAEGPAAAAGERAVVRPVAPREPAAPREPLAPRPSSPAAMERVLPVLPDGYDELRAEALGCTRCGLAGGRTQVVFSDGPPDARLVVVGEAPGANEDATGRPFVGAAGRFLDLLLATVDLSREESVYICNVLKCRPPGNRNPLPDEIEACAPYLRKQIELVRPEAILAVGSFAAQLLTGHEGSALGKLRGQVHAFEGVPLVVTYHPAALLRNGRWTRAFWDDLQLLRSVMDGSAPEAETAR